MHGAHVLTIYSNEEYLEHPLAANQRENPISPDSKLRNVGNQFEKKDDSKDESKADSIKIDMLHSQQLEKYREKYWKEEEKDVGEEEEEVKIDDVMRPKDPMDTPSTFWSIEQDPDIEDSTLLRHKAEGSEFEEETKEPTKGGEMKFDIWESNRMRKAKTSPNSVKPRKISTSNDFFPSQYQVIC